MDVFKDGKLNPAWISDADKKDNLMSKVRAYYLPGTKIKPEFKCSASQCKLPVKSAEYLQPSTANYEYNPMMFCFTCNQVYHVLCVGLGKEGIAEEAVPWMCHFCRANVMNPQATAYYTSSGYKQSIENRRKRFLRETTIQSNDKEFDTDGEFDSCDLDSFERSRKFSKQEIQSTSSNDNEKLRHKLFEAKSESKQLMSLLERERNEAQLRLDSMMLEIQKLREEVKSSKQTSEPPSTNDSLLLSTFYAGNANSPESESTRWKCNSDDVRQSQSSQIPSNNSQCDTSTLEVLSRFTVCQERIQSEKELATVRRAMPKIAEFNGEVMKWLEFEQDVNRYRTVCKYDDQTIKLHVRGALKGDAFEAVKDVFDIFTLKQVMDILKESFGDPMIMLRHKSNDIKALRIPDTIYREDAVKIRVVLQGYFAACTYAKTGYLNSNELAELIYVQFNYEDKARCKEMFIRKNPGKQIVICLNTIYDYLAERLLILDEKPDNLKEDKKSKTMQVMSIGNVSTSEGPFNDKGSYKFEIRDRSDAPFMGYDMQAINSMDKHCEFCDDDDHFSVQCSKYQEMSEEQRLKAVNEKRLCRNCILSTGHKSYECNLKVSCGMKLGKFGRCSQKHHASIHSACDKNNYGGYLKHRSHTRTNTDNAQQTLKDALTKSNDAVMQNNNVGPQNNIPAPQDNITAQQSNTSQPQQNVMAIQQQQVANAIQRANAQLQNINANVYATQSSRVPAARTYNVTPNNLLTVQINHVAEEVPRTVKMFKHKFIGPNGNVVAHSIGDSASEVTLVRNDLRVALGIEGIPEILSVTWTDKTVREYEAIKFDMKLQGILNYSEPIVLKDCYAIEELNLPARTLDMERMKSLFPYLKDVNFESYFNEEPVMLIGSPHAYAIESIKGLIEGGPGNPVALETKLGVTVYGGDSKKCYPLSKKIVTNSSIDNNPVIQAPVKLINEELLNSLELLGQKAGYLGNTEDKLENNSVCASRSPSQQTVRDANRRSRFKSHCKQLPCRCIRTNRDYEAHSASIRVPRRISTTISTSRISQVRPNIRRPSPIYRPTRPPSHINNLRRRRSLMDFRRRVSSSVSEPERSSTNLSNGEDGPFISSG